jgi:pectate lyase
MLRARAVLFALASAILLGSPVWAADVPVKTRDELMRALREAKAGTTVVIAAGTYDGGFSGATLAGTADQPIVLRGADPGNPPVFSGGGAGLHLSSAQHVELRDLVVQGARGNGLNFDDGGKPGSAHDIILKNVTVRDVGPDGNRDGIKLSGLDRFRLEGCQVSQWGSGGSAIDMVGCHNGEISGCRFEKARGDQANGVQAKGGSQNITIRRCRFENAGGRAVNAGGSTGLPYFRPADADYEARNITVEDCEFLGGQAAVAFVGVDGATMRHNTIYRPRKWAFRILQENTDARFVPSRNGVIEKNLIVFRGDEMTTAFNIGGKTAPETFRLEANQWYCIDRPEQTERGLRLPFQEARGRYGTEPRLKNAETGELMVAGRGPEDPGVRP